MSCRTKKILWLKLTAFLAFALISSKSFSSSYVTVKGGLASPDKIYEETRYNFAQFDFKNGSSFSLAIGKNKGPFSYELEISHRTLDATELYSPATGIESTSGHQTQTGLLLNGYYDIYDGEMLSANISAGLGQTLIDWNDIASQSFSAINDSDKVTTYKIGIGLLVKFNDKLSLPLEYSRLIIDDITIKDGNGTVGTINNQNIVIFNIGLTYTFN